MTDQTVIDLGARAVMVAMQISAPVLIAALVTGVAISVVQAATQIQEQTLSFVPKILMITLALMVCGPWIIQIMTAFTTDIFNGIPGVNR
ncbi:MAG: flagellar biosynthesis protein FliQ [Deltaproteobacteria bacterium]|jgi:flagellar biosynthetic protein FliQ|nr:flagellar biosynthesis protein FliQ [Deltaproteobacteria bacterium]